MDVSKNGRNSGSKPPPDKLPKQEPKTPQKKTSKEKSSSVLSGTTEKSSLSSAGATETSSSASSAVKEKSSSGSKSRMKVESFLEALPRSMNTRRRYSAFRPVPFPNTWDEERRSEETEDSSLLLAGDEIEEKISISNVVEEGRTGASDLDVFLTNRMAKNQLKDDGLATADDLPDQLKKGYRKTLLISFIILFALFTLCQLITFSCLLGLREVETEGRKFNGTRMMRVNSTVDLRPAG